MADLESFFAKKDKKKKSKKTETFTPEDVLKKIEQDSQSFVDNGYDSTGDPPPKTALGLPSTNMDDEEWADLDADKEIDLSSLKIQDLGDKEKERQEEEEQEELQKAVEESKSTMKWNIARKEESSDDEEEEIAKPTDSTQPEEKTDQSQQTATATELPTKPAADAKYIPPALRAAQALEGKKTMATAASGGQLEKTSIKRTGLRNQKIDVNSVDEFPSLGVAIKNTIGAGSIGAQSADGSGAFMSVQKGARRAHENTDQGAISTTNKFSMLKGKGSKI